MAVVYFSVLLADTGVLVQEVFLCSGTDNM